ncbi:MAG: haloacid dehalogenase [Leptotrichia sp.]|jgi:HAD phosphoserine phosphatase-like hydrolase, family IB|nr:MAG: haloacid dehalogenase [Leptotrichia sp.]
MNKKRIFLIDFDRTISNEDSTDVLLETHNPEFKKDLRKRYKAGKVTIRQFIKEGLSSLNITKDEYIKTLQEKVTIDESFKDFVKSGLEFRIVSAGSRLNVQGSLLGYGIDLPDEKIISNDLKFDGNKITVENLFLDKEKIYGVDKKEAVEKFKKQGYEVIYVGDGPSDYRAMEVADFVLVRKGTRAVKFCSENGINFREFESFSEILKTF